VINVEWRHYVYKTMTGEFVPVVAASTSKDVAAGEAMCGIHRLKLSFHIYSYSTATVQLHYNYSDSTVTVAMNSSIFNRPTARMRLGVD
jgi:hypothetical protein